MTAQTEIKPHQLPEARPACHGPDCHASCTLGYGCMGDRGAAVPRAVWPLLLMLGIFAAGLLL